MEGKIKVSLIKSSIGRPKKHRKILKSIKLTKLNSITYLEETPAVRAMIKKISHLIKIEEDVEKNEFK